MIDHIIQNENRRNRDDFYIIDCCYFTNCKVGIE